MNENTDLLPNLSSQEDAFEVQLRGYSRRQVDEFVARCRSQVRELEERLGRSLDETERDLILDALRTGQGSRREVAERLGISQRTLRYKLARLREAGVDVPAA